MKILSLISELVQKFASPYFPPCNKPRDSILSVSSHVWWLKLGNGTSWYLPQHSTRLNVISNGSLGSWFLRTTSSHLIIRAKVKSFSYQRPDYEVDSVNTKRINVILNADKGFFVTCYYPHNHHHYHHIHKLYNCSCICKHKYEAQTPKKAKKTKVICWWKMQKSLYYSHPIIIIATAKIFSPSVVGEMLPKPMLVRLVMVKYSEVM